MGLAAMIGLPGFESQYGVLMAGTLVGIFPLQFCFLRFKRISSPG